MSETFQAWIDKVKKSDPGLGAALAGVTAVIKEEHRITFVWSSNMLLKRAEGLNLSEHLGAFKGRQIVHTSSTKLASEDSMLDEALKLGGRLTNVEIGDFELPSSTKQGALDF